MLVKHPVQELPPGQKPALVYEYKYENSWGEDILLVSIPAHFDRASWVAGYELHAVEAGTVVSCWMARPELRSYQVHHNVDSGSGQLEDRMWPFYATSDEDLQKQLNSLCSITKLTVTSITKVVPE